MPALLRARTGSARGALAWTVPLLLTLGACQAAPDGGAEPTLRLGYFATVTHAPALVGLATGSLADALGETELAPQVFGAGPAAIEALNAGAIDAAFIGPAPAITGFVQTDGQGLRIVSGATAGGAQLVVQPDVSSPADLRGATLASPQLGGTQDVALRTWLREQGIVTDLRGGGDASITPTASALALQLFRDSEISGAWLPEPWASRAVIEAGGTVLVDEAELWPNRVFPTTYLVVSADYLAGNPDAVADLVRGLADTIEWIEADRARAHDVVADSLRSLGLELDAEVLDRALSRVEFTLDPLAEVIPELRDRAVAAGTTPEAPLIGIVDLRTLNALRAERGAGPIPDAGLGVGGTAQAGHPAAGTPDAGHGRY